MRCSAPRQQQASSLQGFTDDATLGYAKVPFMLSSTLTVGAGAKLELDPPLTDRSRGADQFRFAAISGRIVSPCWSMGSRRLRQICFLLGAITAIACVARVVVPPAFAGLSHLIQQF